MLTRLFLFILHDVLESGEVLNLNTIAATTSSLLKVNYINGGEADSILIEKNKKFMLIDDGNKANIFKK